MLEQLLVQLQYPYTANCQKCSHILFEIKLIDQFLRTKDIEGKHLQKQQQNEIKYTAKFYLLAQGIIPSSLEINKSTYLSQQKPFYMQFLGEIKCLACKEKIGVKMLTVSSSFHYPELLDRILIEVDKVKIRTLKQDVTQQVVARFRDAWEQETSTDQLELPENLAVENKKGDKKQDKQPKNKKQKEKQENQQEKQKKRKTLGGEKAFKKEEAQLKYLRKQLQQESDQQKQIIQQIVSSIDFFNEVLTNLQKRVSQAEDVCNVLKERVQKIVPLIRRKSQN